MVTARAPQSLQLRSSWARGSRGEGALLLAGVQEDLIGVLRVWGSRVSVVCAPALLAKEQEKANSGLSDRKPDVGGGGQSGAVE